MARYTPLFYRGAPASIPQVVAHLQRALSEEDPNYEPLRQRMPPASIPDIVAHIQKYLTENQFVSIDELGEALTAYLEAHPEVIGVATLNGETGNVVIDAGTIPMETGEEPTIAGAISYLSSALALLTTEAVQSVNGISPGTGQNVTLTGANIPIDGSTQRTLDSTFQGATSEAAGSKGLVPAPAAGDGPKVLSGAGTWVDFPVQTVQKVCNVTPDSNHNIPLKGTDIPLQTMSLQTVTQAITAASTPFTGATSSTAGTKGQVPAPAAGDENKVLSGAGTWVPQATGGGDVQTVNSVSPDGQGNVKITGSDIETSSTDNTPIATSLSSLNDQIGKVLSDAIEVTLPNVSSSNLTFAVTGITANHTLVQEGCAYLSNPAAITGDFNLITGAGTVTVSGTLTGTTNIIATFAVKQQSATGTAES